MKCELRERDGIYACKFYTKPGYCTTKYYFCIDYILDTQSPSLSYSSVQVFDRCPYSWFLSYIRGIELKDRFKPVVMRQGQYLHSLTASHQKPQKSVYFSPDEEVKKAQVDVIFSMMKELELLPNGEQVGYEVDLRSGNLHGIIDIRHESAFSEIKFTGRPEFYLNSFIAQSQLEFYFLLLPNNIKSCNMLPIRQPQLRFGKDEVREKFVNRLKTDIRRRPKHYFPEYRAGREQPKWGRQFFKDEFNLVTLQGKIKWVKEDIVKSLEERVFIQRKTNCLWPGECQFMSVCETGKINTHTYKRKERKEKI